jgi:hypothetical protein
VSEPFRTPYEGYDVLAKWDTPSWDEITRQVVGKRLHQVPERRFLEPSEWETLEAICARLIPQPDRALSVPIVPFIDEKLHNDEGDGYRYANMPDLRTAWRLGIAGIEKEAHQRHHTRFSELKPEQQDEILCATQNEKVEGKIWDKLPPKKFFTNTLLKTVAGIYYSHPAAWSEIGWGGPASPRGYVRRGLNEHDAWEAAEAWNPVTETGP